MVKVKVLPSPSPSPSLLLEETRLQLHHPLSHVPFPHAILQKTSLLAAPPAGRNGTSQRVGAVHGVHKETLKGKGKEHKKAKEILPKE